MVEFELKDFNWTEARCLELLRGLWQFCLRYDQYWHFFWEGDYTVVRCSLSFQENVSGFLKRNGVVYAMNGEWVDNIPITKKYQKQFMGMFHAFSELAMQMEDDEFRLILDRVCHCFLNNCHTLKRVHKADDLVGTAWASTFWESLCLADVATGRAYTIGRMNR